MILSAGYSAKHINYSDACVTPHVAPTHRFVTNIFLKFYIKGSKFQNN